MALAQMKQVCLDSEDVCHPSPPVPPTVPPSAESPSVPPLVDCTAADVRRVIVQDVRQVVDVSESPIDVSSSSPLSQDNTVETERTLKILREVFHKPAPAALPPQRCCSTVESTTSTDNGVGVVSSPVLFDDVSPSSSRSSSPVAPPLPVGAQLHPVRKLYDPATHRRVPASNDVLRPSVSGMVAGLINEIRKESPPVSPTSGVTENMVNVVQNECSGNGNDNIPSAQPRRPRSPDIAAVPPVQPDPPPPPLLLMSLMRMKTLTHLKTC